MTIISPSLLSCDFLNIRNEIKLFDQAKNVWFHLDIMDGHFVPNLTFGHPVVKLISQVTKLPLDAHFMVTNPNFYIETFANFNIHNFTFHWEAANHHDRVISQIKEKYPSVGISLNPATPLNVIPDYILQKIDLVLLMSVNPGFGGQAFIPAMLDKVQELSERKSKLKAHFQIQVDGGVTDSNSKLLIDMGATNLVAGSFVFKDGPSQYMSNIEKLRN